MQFSEEQVRKLQSHLMRNRPCITRSDQRESRRIEGEIVDDDVDANGYLSVVVYIQRGLGNQNEVVSQVLRRVAWAQNERYSDYLVNLFSFGWDDGTLHHKGRNRMGGRNVSGAGWAQELLDLATTDVSPEQPVIPALFPQANPVGIKHKVERDDLLVFFCRDRNVCMSEEAKAQYAKHPIKQSVWIFCEDDNLDISLGAFDVKTYIEQSTLEATVAANPIPAQPNQPMTAMNRNKYRRGLSDEFMVDLKEGILKAFLEVLLLDDTLSLNIRRDCINIYYRGGSLLKITKSGRHRYRLKFDENYLDEKYVKGTSLSRLGISKTDIVSLPEVIKSGDGDSVALWTHQIPLMKAAMDLRFRAKPWKERELQQLVERMNNSDYATDYFICDIEYMNRAYRGLRADMIGVHWTSRSAKRRDYSSAHLVIAEMKHMDPAIPRISGLADHISKLENARIDWSELAEEMVVVFNQRVDLGLIRCHSDRSKQPKLKSIQSSRPEYLIILSDHDPESTVLQRELDVIAGMGTPAFDIRVAVANMMGYGLFEHRVHALENFRTYLSQTAFSRIPSHSGVRSAEDVDYPGDEVASDTKMCHICHIRPATEFRPDTWLTNRPNPPGVYLCSECSSRFMY